MTATQAWEETYGGAARDLCRRTLLELAAADPRVICVDSDTGGLEDLFAELPRQYVNVGIAEANMISMAAGLAAAGLRPFVHTLSSFAAARACEQIKIDVAGNNLPVRIVVTHGGLSAGHYGPTHHAVEDVALMRTMPNLTVLVPADAVEADLALRAAHELAGPVFLRLGRAPTPLVHRGPCDFEVGRALRLRDGDDVTIVATGPYPVLMGIEAVELLAGRGVRARLLDMHTVKPLDRGALVQAARETGAIVTVEDHVLVGGLGGAVCEVVAEEHPCPVRRIGVPDAYNDRVGDELHLLNEAGVSVERIAAAVLELLGVRAGR
ncbi:transketolase family protein [Nonomuraea fuscirosea]|uniref:transketolase family protein n=1 Tax=Nonomuraea fuscirosea TaxID=1291556 RepID=UPI003403A628